MILDPNVEMLQYLCMNERKDHIELEQAKINLETAQIAWSELQRFFAAGQAYSVDESLDLTEVALRMSKDDSDYVAGLIENKQIDRVSDEQAIAWIECDALVWCVVVKPYILVQPVSEP